MWRSIIVEKDRTFLLSNIGHKRSFSCISSNWQYILAVIVSPGSCDESNWPQTTKLSLWSSFGEILTLGNVVKLRLDPVNESIVANYYKESIFHRTLQFVRENESFLLRKRRADDISKRFFLCSLIWLRHPIKHPIYQAFLFFQFS